MLSTALVLSDPNPDSTRAYTDDLGRAEATSCIVRVQGSSVAKPHFVTQWAEV